MSNPTIGLAIPVYTEPVFLAELLESIRSQLKFLDSVVFVDDDSSEMNRALLADFAASCPDKIKVFHNDQPLGICKTTEIAIKHSETDFVCFVDSDDIVHSQAFKKIRRIILAAPDLDLLSTRFAFLNSSSGNKRTNIRRDKIKEKTDWVDLVITDNQISHLKVASRKLLSRMNWDSRMDGVQDAILNFQLALEDKVWLVPKVLYFHRVHGAQHSGTMTDSAARELNFYRRKFLQRVFPKEVSIPRLEIEKVVGFGQMLEKEFLRSTIVSVNRDSLTPKAIVDKIRLIQGSDFRDSDVIVRPNANPYGLSRVLVRLIKALPRSLSFYLDTTRPSSWHFLKVFSGVFDTVYVNDGDLVPLVRSFMPSEIPVRALNSSS